MSYETETKLTWGIVWAILFTSIAIVAGVIAIDKSGHQSWMHSGPIPPGVTQMSSYEYILDSHAGLHSASQICSHGGVGQLRDLGSKGVYIACSNVQRWNDHQPPSPNTIGAFLRFVSIPWVWGGGAILWFLCLLPGLFALRRDWILERRKRKAARLKLDQERHALTKARTALIEEWSKSDSNISMVDFEHRLGEIDEAIAKQEGE